MNILGAHLYQHTSWHCCERLCSASVNFLWRLFQCVCPFHDEWFTSASAHTALSVQQFLTKNSMTPIPHSPYPPDLAPKPLFFVSLDEKVLRGKRFDNVEEVKQKMAEALKGIKIDGIKNCFEQWKKCLNRCIASWRGLWSWLKFKHVRINAQFFINKILFRGWLPPHKHQKRSALPNFKLLIFNYLGSL